MSKNKIVVLSVVFIVMIGFIVFIFNKKSITNKLTQRTLTSFVVSTSSIPLVTASSVPVFPHDVKYLADGKVDTSEWQEFRSEYGGFSVRAPKNDSSIGCYGHGCDPARDGEPFFYSILPPEEAPGLGGMSIFVIKKINGTTLNTWMDTYVVSGKENIYSVMETVVQGYTALQFDTYIPSKDSFTFIKEVVYPSGSGYEGNITGLPGMYIRHYVIDVKDHYIILSYTTNINNDVFFKSFAYIAPLYPKSFDNKTLADIYKAILDSLQIFSPTKK